MEVLRNGEKSIKKPGIGSRHTSQQKMFNSLGISIVYCKLPGCGGGGLFLTLCQAYHQFTAPLHLTAPAELVIKLCIVMCLPAGDFEHAAVGGEWIGLCLSKFHIAAYAPPVL